MIRAIQFQNKRVGSTFLQNAINSSGNVMGIDEVFVNMAKKPGMRKSGFVPYLRSDAQSPKEYIEDVIYKTHDDKGTIFKLMYNQINHHAGLMQYIRDNKIPMIHLMRKNLVKQVISGMTAATTKHDPLNVSGEVLLNMVKEADSQNKSWAKQLKGHIKLILYYEDIIGETVVDPSSLKGRTYMDKNTNIAVCDFLGIDQVQLFAETKKKNKEDLSVYLPNIENIKKTFKGSGYLWMLKKGVL